MTTIAADTLRWLGIDKRKKRCNWLEGYCQIQHREAENGDRVFVCGRCGHVQSIIKCADYEWEIYKACINYPEAAYAYCNWSPRDPEIKRMWDKRIGRDSSNYGHSPQDLAYMAEVFGGKGE